MPLQAAPVSRRRARKVAKEMSETKLVKIIPRPAAWDEVRKPLTANVNEQNPLEVDLMTSFRSGYCYLAMDRYAALQRDYYVKVNVRFVRPVLMRDPERTSRQGDGLDTANVPNHVRRRRQLAESNPRSPERVGHTSRSDGEEVPGSKRALFLHH